MGALVFHHGTSDGDVFAPACGPSVFGRGRQHGQRLDRVPLGERRVGQVPVGAQFAHAQPGVVAWVSGGRRLGSRRRFFGRLVHVVDDLVRRDRLAHLLHRVLVHAGPAGE